MTAIKSIFCAIFITAAIGSFSSLDAQSRHSNTEIGIILGDPTGLSLKFWQSNTTAFDAAFAWSIGKKGNVLLHANYLVHSWQGVSRGSLALYYGLGARIIFADDPVFGARIPLGLQYIIPSTRLSFFAEVAPTLDLIPSTSFDVNGGIGLRIFL